MSWRRPTLIGADVIEASKREDLEVGIEVELIEVEYRSAPTARSTANHGHTVRRRGVEP
jgi:hypothetical protein